MCCRCLPHKLKEASNIYYENNVQLIVVASVIFWSMLVKFFWDQTDSKLFFHLCSFVTPRTNTQKNTPTSELCNSVSYIHKQTYPNVDLFHLSPSRTSSGGPHWWCSLLPFLFNYPSAWRGCFCILTCPTRFTSVFLLDIQNSYASNPEKYPTSTITQKVPQGGCKDFKSFSRW